MRTSGIQLALITTLSILLFMQCISEPGKVEEELAVFIDSLEKDVIPLSTELNIVWHKANISGNEEAFKKAAELQIKLAGIYSGKERFNQLQTIKEKDSIDNELLKRQLDLLYNKFLGNQADPLLLEEIIQAETALEKKYTGFRASIEGDQYTDNQLENILKKSTDKSALKKAWLASKVIGDEVAEDVVKLVKLRNKLARELGFTNYHEMSLKLSEQDPEDVLSLFNELDELTGETFAEVKKEIDQYLAGRYNVKIKELRPWHYQNRFFQEAPEIFNVDVDKYYKNKDIVAISRDYYEGIGLPVDDILKNSDLFEKEGKNQHAYCTDIDRKGDVRILANIQSNGNWMNTMLHELGHGVYSKYNDPELPYFLRTHAHAFTTEAIANMFGRLYSNPEWIIENTGNDEDETEELENEMEELEDDLHANLRVGQLVFSRWCQVMYRFEKQLYENPDQDLNALWRDLVENYQLLRQPEGRNNPDWAAKVHIALYPCYYHNYLLGELLASQLVSYIGSEILMSEDPYYDNFSNNPGIGDYLQEYVFYPGASYHWNEMIENATGEPLTSSYYAEQFIE